MYPFNLYKLHMVINTQEIQFISANLCTLLFFYVYIITIDINFIKNEKYILILN